MAEEHPPLEPLAPSVLRALDAERRRPDVDAAMGDRLLGRVMASVAVGAAVTAAAAGTAKAAGATTASTASAAVATASVAKMAPWILGALLVGGGAGAALHSAFATPKTITVTVPGPTVTVTVPAPPATPATTVVPTAAKPTSSAGDRDTDLAAERALVDRARTALTRGQSASALEALDVHAKQFPRGRLAEEREALAVDALARTGRADEAKARAARFRKTWPSSLFSGVVDSASPP